MGKISSSGDITHGCHRAAYAASPHEGGGYGASPPPARTSQDIESLTTVYFIIALTVMAVLFVVLGVDALTGHNFVNGISGGDGGGLSIAREAYPALLSAIAQESYPDLLSAFGLEEKDFSSFIDSISRNIGIHITREHGGVTLKKRIQK